MDEINKRDLLIDNTVVFTLFSFFVRKKTKPHFKVLE